MANNITFVATLRDQVSGPTKKVTKSILEIEQATNRAAITAGRYSDAQGRLREANGRFVSASDKARMATDRQVGASRRLGMSWDNTGRKLIGGATGAYRAAGSVDRLTQRLGIADRMSKVFGVRVAQTLLRLPGQANDAAGGFGGAMSRLSGFATTASERIQSAMSTAAKGVALTGAALAGIGLVGGAKRLMSLESAAVKLEVAGYDEKAREGIMDTVNTSVEGTPFGLDAAATAATQYLASGVTPEDLESKLGTTVDLAAVYDMDLGEASGIFSKVIANGAVQGDEAAQLLDRGLNIYGPLAKQLEVEQSEVKGLISEGKVSAEDLFAALAPAVDGGAEKLGGTFKGVFANMRTALYRSGAEFEKPLMEPLKDLQKNLTGLLKDAAPFFKSLGESLAPGLALAAEKAPELGRALAPLGPPLLALFEAVGDALPGIISGLTTWASILAPIAGFFIRIGAAIIEHVAPHLGWIVPATLAFGALSTTLFGVTLAVLGFRAIRFLAPLMMGITRSVYGSATAMKILTGGAKLLTGALRFMFPVAFKAAGALKLLAVNPLTWVFLAVWGLGQLYDNSEKIRKVFDAISDLVQGLIDKFDLLIGKADDWASKKFGLDNQGTARDANQALDVRPEAWQNFTRPFEEWAGFGAGWGTGEGLLRFAHGSQGETEGDLPRHAEGGFTLSGAHMAVLGERGREYVVNNVATEKLASIPGAIPAIAQGRLPVQGVPVPAGAGGSGGGVSIGELKVYTSATDGAEFARQFAREFPRHYQAATARDSREHRMMNSTLTKRGAN